MVPFELWNNIEGVTHAIRVELLAHNMRDRMFSDFGWEICVSAWLNVLEAGASKPDEYGVAGIGKRHRGTLGYTEMNRSHTSCEIDCFF